MIKEEKELIDNIFTDVFRFIRLDLLDKDELIKVTTDNNDYVGTMLSYRVDKFNSEDKGIMLLVDGKQVFVKYLDIRDIRRV